MTMQNNIDIVRRNIWRNMLQSKFQAIALEIDNQRPVGVPVAIAAHHSERRTDRFEIGGDGRFANITQMPDLISACRQIKNRLWKLVMRICQNQNFHRALGGSAAPRAMLNKCGFAAITNIERRSARSTFKHIDCFTPITP